MLSTGAVKSDLVCCFLSLVLSWLGVFLACGFLGLALSWLAAFLACCFLGLLLLGLLLSWLGALLACCFLACCFLGLALCWLVALLACDFLGLLLSWLGASLACGFLGSVLSWLGAWFEQVLTTPERVAHPCACLSPPSTSAALLAFALVCSPFDVGCSDCLCSALLPLRRGLLCSGAWVWESARLLPFPCLCSILLNLLPLRRWLTLISKCWDYGMEMWFPVFGR